MRTQSRIIIKNIGIGLLVGIACGVSCGGLASILFKMNANVFPAHPFEALFYGVVRLIRSLLSIPLEGYHGSVALIAGIIGGLFFGGLFAFMNSRAQLKEPRTPGIAT